MASTTVLGANEQTERSEDVVSEDDAHASLSSKQQTERSEVVVSEDDAHASLSSKQQPERSEDVVSEDDAHAVLSSKQQMEQSEEVVSEEDAHASLSSKQAESSNNSYDSDYGDSDCSVTSGLNGHLLKESAFFTDRQAGVATADESGETTWTDEKHSSYLDSMEAIFVQKMYDKEYCSLDVCGHSSRSTLSLDLECVESQPFCLNMRKPRETKIAGLVTFKAPSRPLSLVPSMLTSPWIQHFKSPRYVTKETGRMQDKPVQPLQGHIFSKEDCKVAATTHACSSLNEDGPQESPDSTYKKRDIASEMQAGEYKKHKCQHLPLSQLDILMEQQYDLEQQRKMKNHKLSEDGHEDLEKHLIEHSNHNKETFPWKNIAFLEDSVLEEKQELDSSTELKPPSIFVSGMVQRKLDQVVPSFQSVGEDACAKVISGGLHGDEDANRTKTTEGECVTTRSGSKIRTWGIQGPRYHVIKQTSAHSFHP